MLHKSKTFLKSLAKILGYQVKKEPPTSQNLRAAYLNNGRVPWSVGYSAYRSQYIESQLRNARIMQTFFAHESLPPGYGVALDERCVEIPWLLSRAPRDAGRWLDAGSACNHPYVLSSEIWQNKKLHILTLGQESYRVSENNVSYVYEDLRNLPYRDNFFQIISCISTLEHVGMDNTQFVDQVKYKQNNTHDYIKAINELSRVLDPRGVVFISVPFGVYCNYGLFQQFDKKRVDSITQRLAGFTATVCFFKYDQNGWQMASADSCSRCEFSQQAIHHFSGRRAAPEHDRAAAARAVACLELRRI